MSNLNATYFRKDSQQAFKDALEKGALSIASSDKTFAGNFMYMDSTINSDSFKNITTRKYITVSYDCPIVLPTEKINFLSMEIV